MSRRVALRLRVRDEPESTYEHYYKYGTGDATEGEHLGGKDSFNFGAETQFLGAELDSWCDLQQM